MVVGRSNLDRASTSKIGQGRLCRSTGAVSLVQRYQSRTEALGLIGQNNEYLPAADDLIRTFGQKAEARRNARVGLGTSRTSLGAAVRARRQI